MSDFTAKLHQIRFQTPLGELTTLAQTPQLDFRGLLERKGEGREPTSKGREGKGRYIKGETTSKGGEQREGPPGTCLHPLI